MSHLLFHPALLLIDHGHFQYNGVSLGFCLLSMSFSMRNHFLRAVSVDVHLTLKRWWN